MNGHGGRGRGRAVAVALAFVRVVVWISEHHLTRAIRTVIVLLLLVSLVLLV